MNLIQIANGMGDHMTFGDLPRYSYIISKINAILPEEDAITATTKGSEFIVVYEKLKQGQQNQLAVVLEADFELRLEIVTDIACREISERRRERQNFKNNIRLFLIGILLLTMVNLYCAYTYHQVAVSILGTDYDSQMIGVLKALFSLYDSISNTTNP